MYTAILNASIIVPVFLYNFFFVNLVLFILGSSLLRFAVSLCSFRSMIIGMKAIGNYRNITPEYPTNQSLRKSVTETKKLVLVKGGCPLFKILSLADRRLNVFRQSEINIEFPFQS